MTVMSPHTKMEKSFPSTFCTAPSGRRSVKLPWVVSGGEHRGQREPKAELGVVPEPGRLGPRGQRLHRFGLEVLVIEYYVLSEIELGVAADLDYDDLPNPPGSWIFIQIPCRPSVSNMTCRKMSNVESAPKFST